MIDEKNLSELVANGIIDEPTAQSIQQYFAEKSQDKPNRILVIFSVLGALLVGLGIILIVAHNWDNMSRPIKTILSFLPVIIGQIACGYTFFKRMDSQAWREGSATFLLFAIGACISLVSQIYHIDGNMAVFIASWAILVLPLLYLFRSTVVGLLYIAGITFYALNIQESVTAHWTAHYYWILLLLALPHYYYLYKNHPNSNSLQSFHLFVPLSFLLTWPFVIDSNGTYVLPAYVSILACIYLLGHAHFFRPKHSTVNVYTFIGSLGTVGILLACSFGKIWKIIFDKDRGIAEAFSYPSLYVTLVFTLVGIFLLIKNMKGKNWVSLKPIAWVFPIFFLLFYLVKDSFLATIIINILVLLIGILTIKEGAQRNHLGILNYGLLIITALIAIRFFDTDISFVWRGLIFLFVGAGFFLMNNWMIRKRQSLN